MRPLAALGAFVFLLAASACDNEDGSGRRVEDGVLYSSALPKMTFTPAEEFHYAGDVSLPIKGVAQAERYHWVAADDDGRIRRMLIVQLEGFNDDIDDQYNIKLPSAELTGSNYKFTDTLVTLGGKDFVHNTWAFDNAKSASETPDLEAAATLNLLTDKGYILDGELIMSRYARAVGDDRRHELILFYMEPVADSGFSLADFPDGEPLTPVYETYSDAVRERGGNAFSIRFDD